MNRIHLGTARLLTQVAPLVFVDDRLALKGGTAINLFHSGYASFCGNSTLRAPSPAHGAAMQLSLMEYAGRRLISSADC
jgi:hypothetical protein